MVLHSTSSQYDGHRAKFHGVYSQVTNVNNVRPSHDPSQNKRHSWCTTSRLLPDIHSIFQKSDATQIVSQSLRASLVCAGRLQIFEFPSLITKPTNTFSNGCSNTRSLAPLFYAQALHFRESPEPRHDPTMTPSKEKLPLPSSTSMAFPVQPITFDQWKTALQQVKLLYQKRQWKECVARCNQLLLEPKISVW